MAATNRSSNLRDARKDRKEEKWAAFFDDEVRVEETWDASIEAILGRRKVTEEDDD
jgi:hypothetical protein